MAAPTPIINEEEGENELAEDAAEEVWLRRLAALASTFPSIFCCNCACAALRERIKQAIIVKAHRMDIGVDPVEPELDINLWPRECYIYPCHN
jgi:hypothetical protein